MTTFKTGTLMAAITAAALVGSSLTASAQLTNGPNGRQPNILSSRNPDGPNGKMPSRATMYKHPRRMMRRRHTSDNAVRPLTVRPVVAPVVAVAPVGPGNIVTGPLGFGSSLVSLPFRSLNSIFPATGDIASNPLVVIGGPIRIAGDIAQLPFRVLGAPFGGTTIATY